MYADRRQRHAVHRARQRHADMQRRRVRLCVRCGIREGWGHVCLPDWTGAVRRAVHSGRRALRVRLVWWLGDGRLSQLVMILTADGTVVLTASRTVVWIANRTAVLIAIRRRKLNDLNRRTKGNRIICTCTGHTHFYSAHRLGTYSMASFGIIYGCD